MRNPDRALYPFVVSAMIFGFVSAAHVRVQADEIRAQENRTLELVDHLKSLIRSTEQNPKSSYWLTQQLRDLVHRYDWPWRVSLLHDDFRDGDYEYNPHWVVNSGDFWVTRDATLRSVFDAPRQNRRLADRQGGSPAIDILQDILWGGNENERSRAAISPSAGEIYTRLPISSAFAAKLTLFFDGNPDAVNRLELGPFQGDERSSGYRLAYESGKAPSFTLLRSAPGRSAVIEMYDRAVKLEDGSAHTLEWRRQSNGEMVVLLDEKEIMRTVDRAYSDSFDGFTFINKGGAYELRDIAIFGSRQEK
jgi:hypothetical protein